MKGLKYLNTLFCLIGMACSHPMNDIFGHIDGSKHNHRLPNNTVPIQYHVKLNPNMFSENVCLDGQTVVTFKVLRSTSKVTVHAKHLLIDEAHTVLTNDTDKLIKPVSHEYDSVMEMLHLNLPYSLECGIYTLNMTYTTTTQEDLHGYYGSFYEDTDNNTVWLLATHFQPIHARRVFPCWDEPALKATFKISIKHYSNYTALSNMPVNTQEFDSVDGKIWTHFQVTPIMSTNVLGFVIADYVNVTNEDGTIRIWTRRNAIEDATYMLNVVERADRILSIYMNSTVRVPKMDHVTVPHYSSRATENWGLIVYQELALLHNNDVDTSDAKVSNILTAVHEVAHQWFGNLVSPAWWKYYWLSEGTTTYLKYYITDMLYNNLQLMDAFVVWVQQESAYTADDMSDAVPVNKDFTHPRDILRRSPAIIYRKSAALLRMLSHILTEEVFRVGLLRYVAEHEYGSVTSDDLWEAMQYAADNMAKVNRSVNVKKVMDTWIEQTGYPVVNVTRNYTNGDVIITQQPSPTNADSRHKRWWIPISYTYESRPDFSSTQPLIWLSPDEDSIAIKNIPISDWIIINLQETGYYRVNYDPSSWMKITQYLDSDNYTMIHVLNRAQLIDDAYKFLIKGWLDPYIFTKLLNYLKRETDDAPWIPVFRALQQVKKYLRIPAGATLFNQRILNLMDSYIESSGFDGRSNDTLLKKLSRGNILKWACRLGHVKCRETLVARLASYVQDPVQNRIPPDLRHSVYCLGLMEANQTIWTKLLNLLKYPLTFRDLEYLGCSEDTSVVRNYLRILLLNETILPREEFSTAIRYLRCDNFINTDVALDFIIDNWNQLSEREFSPNMILDAIIARVVTQDQFDKLRTFLRANAPDKLLTLTYHEEATSRLLLEITTISNWLANAEGLNGSEITL